MIGDSFIWTEVNGIYAKLQKWFSGYDMSHIAISSGYMAQVEWKYEAVAAVGAFPYYPQDNIKVYPCPYPKEVIEEAIRKVAKKSYGKIYGFMQIFYFPRRFIYEKIPFLWWIRCLFNDCESPKKLNNWFPRSYICTEVWYDIVKYCAEKVKDTKMLSVMNEYHGNNLYVSDCYKMIIRGWE